MVFVLITSILFSMRRTTAALIDNFFDFLALSATADRIYRHEVLPEIGVQSFIKKRGPCPEGAIGLSLGF